MSNRMLPQLTMLSVSLFAAACNAPPTFDLAATRAVITAQNAQFTKAHVAGDTAAIDSMFMANARSMPPESDAVVDLPAIHALTVGYLRAGVSAFHEETATFAATPSSWSIRVRMN